MATSMNKNKYTKLRKPSREQADSSGRTSRDVKSEVKDEDDYSFETWTPSLYTAFKALLSARLCAAIWSNISDCDETFNYWEPMHYLLHGYGFQTWEYSPVHAIRSYAFLWLYAWPVKIYNCLFGANKIVQFYILRCFMALISALCDAYFYKAICHRFGANTGRIVLCLLVFCAGIYNASTAFLPSTFTMYTTAVAIGAWYLSDGPVAILATALGAIVGWPFVGALGLPIAYDLVVRRYLIIPFVKWGIIAVVLFLVPMVLIDSYYYGHFVFSSLNILLYNVFSDHGPELYGVEPWSFYFINCSLNFNIIFPLALVSLPLAVVLSYILNQPKPGIPLWLALSPMYIWIIIFFTRPHKEERFLFPIYPLICMAGAVSIDYLQKFYALLQHSGRSGKGRSTAATTDPVPVPHYTSSTYAFPIFICTVFAILSMSRLVALYNGYHAPLELYGTMNQKIAESQISLEDSERSVNICVGKEWYRFPSNFFLPDNKWRLQFIRSEFRGQLPKPYSESENGTRIIPTHMNDMNTEEMSRYVNVTSCQYLIDLDLPTETKYEPRYSAATKDWTVVVSAKFLDSQRSHRFYRAFYIPFLSSMNTQYVDYQVLMSTRISKRLKIPL